MSNFLKSALRAARKINNRIESEPRPTDELMIGGRTFEDWVLLYNTYPVQFESERRRMLSDHAMIMSAGNSDLFESLTALLGEIEETLAPYTGIERVHKAYELMYTNVWGKR
jgi:hypothetical protein